VADDGPDRLPPRLPPGQILTQKWPVLDLGDTPEINLAAWSLTIDGLVDAPQKWDWSTFQAQPQSRFISDIHCVTTWSRFDNQWEGVSARDILERVKPTDEARHVILRSHDGYITNLSLDHFSQDDVILAHSWDGEGLSVAHGGPVRLIVPNLYFWKSAKWLRRITFANEDTPGYWEVRGYHNEGDPWKEERFEED